MLQAIFEENMEDLFQSAEYKKCVFQCARRAILENEYFLKDFLENYVQKTYSLEDLADFNIFLKDIYDSDLFDLIMGKKSAHDLKSQYSYRFLKDIENYAKNIIYKVKSK